MESKHQLRTAILVLGLSISIVPAFSATDERNGFFESAETAFKEQNYSEASWLFQKALKHDPLKQDAKLGLCKCSKIISEDYLEKGEVDQAQSALELGLYFCPSDADLDKRLDQTIVKVGKNPKLSADRILIARQRRGSAQFKQAVTEYLAALRIDQDPSIQVEAASLLLLVLGENEKAATLLRSAIESQKLSYSARASAIWELQRTGEKDVFIKYPIDEALLRSERFKEWKNRCIQKAAAFEEREMYKEAILEISKITNVFGPKPDPELFCKLGNLAERNCDPEQAVEFYKQALHADPDYSPAKKGLEESLNKARQAKPQ